MVLFLFVPSGCHYCHKWCVLLAQLCAVWCHILVRLCVEASRYLYDCMLQGADGTCTIACCEVLVLVRLHVARCWYWYDYVLQGAGTGTIVCCRVPVLVLVGRLSVHNHKLFVRPPRHRLLRRLHVILG